MRPFVSFANLVESNPSRFSSDLSSAMKRSSHRWLLEMKRPKSSKTKKQRISGHLLFRAYS